MTPEAKRHPLFAALSALIVLLPGAASAEGAQAAARQSVLQAAVERGEGLWRQVSNQEMRPTLTSRWLVGYALTLCEAQVHPERLERLLALAREMQDRDPHSTLWGNLRWYWRDEGVTDANAVEFCMHDALLMDIRHRDWLPEKARSELDSLLRVGIEGCLRHRVPTDYTNIAILNAGNLIVLGERLHRSEAAQEGYRRLDALCALTATFGLHEFCSPTYYGTDLNGLLMIFSHAQNQRQRKQADALLRLVWTDIAANWFPAAQRLGGCHSRSYDYLRGLGALDWHLWVHGWLQSASPGSAERCEPWPAQWPPQRDSAGMAMDDVAANFVHARDWPLPPDLARRQLPRLVRQHWGMLPAESRTQMLYADVSLSCCGASYGAQDSTLTVDLPGGRELPRCYFIADGREDPYGKAKFETGAAKHPKALHLQPFWAGAQRSCDALGLVVYRGRDLAGAQVARVQSHFVFRRPDGIWLNGKRLAMPAGTAAKPAETPIADGHLVLRYGSAAIGICARPFCWGHSQDAKLVDDGNSWNCLRLTIDHGRRSDLEKAATNQVAAGAALLVCVGSGLQRDASFDIWRVEFEKDSLGTSWEESSEKFSAKLLRATGNQGPLSIEAEAPGTAAARVHIEPMPCQGVLEVDGKEVGRPLLTAVEPLSSFPPNAGPLHSISVPSGKAVYWEAESGLILPGMEVIEDAMASGKRCVAQEHSSIGQPSGIVLWSLAVEKPGRYWLWARVRSNDAKHGTFSIRVNGENGVLVPPATWQSRSPGEWRWKQLEIEGQRAPVPLDLLKGVCRIELQTRQSGTRIDRLMLSDAPQQQPK